MVLPLKEFYVHPQMADGHLNKCKVCARADVRIQYRTPEGRKRVQQYDKLREQTPERKQQKLETQHRRRVASPQKHKTHILVGNAIRDGRLKRQSCEICGDYAA